MATICWARMSSGASGISMRSNSPWRIPLTRAAHSSNSWRVVAKTRPFETAPCQFCDAVVDFAPHLVGDNWSELAARDFDRQVQLASVVYLHHCGVGTIGTGQEARNNFDGLLRSRKTDPHRAPIGQIFQSLQGKRQVRAALVISDGVDFVHNNSLDIPQDFAALLRGQ